MHAIGQFFVVVLITLASVTAALAQDAVGTITAGSGEILVIRSGNEQPASVGTEIQQYDQIYVGEGSEATVTFVDQTILTLAAQSALTIDEMVYDPAGQDNSALFTLAGGLMGLVSGDILKTGDMTVTTPVSTIGIRGTAVLINSGTTVSYLYGSLGSPGTFVMQTTTATGETVSLVLSEDGTVGTVTVTNYQTGAATKLSAFGDSVITRTVDGGSVQLRSTLTAAELIAKFAPLLQALQNATGKDLGDPANVEEAESLEEALQELFDTFEDDASPD